MTVTKRARKSAPIVPALPDDAFDRTLAYRTNELEVAAFAAAADHAGFAGTQTWMRRVLRRAAGLPQRKL